MSAKDVVAAALLGFGVLVEVIACIGVWAMPNAYGKLHYVGLATSFGAIFIAAAVWVQDPASQAAAKFSFAAVYLLLTSPVLSHATARAVQTRERERLDELAPKGEA